MANIAILTSFVEMNPGYSLTGIVRDQIEMLTRFGNTVYLYVSEKYHGDIPDFPNLIVCKDIPATDLIDYQTKTDITPEHEQVAADFAARLIRDIKNEEIDFIFTHDLIFTGWHLPYALGIQMIGDQAPDVGWLHWVHSIPTGMKDWWIFTKYGPKHKIAYPNKADLILVAEAFRTEYNAVRVIPHIKDIRSFYDFRPETRHIIDLVPALMQASFVQIYPASTDRLEAKRVDVVTKMFGHIKSMGQTVCLFIANQWATGRQRKEDIEKYKKIARECGLVPGRDFIFSSELPDLGYETGIPREVLRELMMLCNLFIYPTREETFGLCLPEIALASGAFCVLNASLECQVEVSNGQAIYFNFGSFNREFNVQGDTDIYYSQLAQITVGRFLQNESIMNKTMIKQRYNMDYLYRRYYAPMLLEVKAI